MIAKTGSTGSKRVPESSGLKTREFDRVDIEKAVYLRHFEGWRWSRIAKEIGTSERALWNWRHGVSHPGVWRELSQEAIARMREEGAAEAWGCLVRNAHNGSTAAAMALLDRIEGKVARKQTPADSARPISILEWVTGAHERLQSGEDAEE
jgi:hypothetical protein